MCTRTQKHKRMPHVKPRTRGRPPRLDRAQIVDAAYGIVEREGVDALTVRRVARELGAAPMALYRHVADKNALLVLVLDAAYLRLKKPRLPRDPRERIIALWCFLHDGLARYPWVVDALVHSDTVAVSVLPQIEAILAASLAGGLELAGAAKLYRLVWQYTVGELTLTNAAAGRITPQTSPVLATVSGASPLRLPLLAQAAPHWAAMRARSLYREGLTAIVDDALRRARPVHPPARGSP